MTELLEKAVAVARGLPLKLQDEMARVLLALAGDAQPAYRLTPAAAAAEQDEADAAEARGDHATDENVLCYGRGKPMTDILEKAVEAMRQMPPAERDSIAQAIVTLARRDDGPVDIEPELLPHVLEGLAQIERGEFATDEEMADAFCSFER